MHVLIRTLGIYRCQYYVRRVCDDLINFVLGYDACVNKNFWLKFFSKFLYLRLYA